MKKIFLMHPFIGPEELEAVKTVFESRYLTEGPVTQEFEKQFAAFVGAEHGISATSCMTSPVLALSALDREGNEVIVPDFTHPATGERAEENLRIEQKNNYQPQRPGESDNIVADTRKLREFFSEAPDTSLDKELQKSFDWLTTLR